MHLKKGDTLGENIILDVYDPLYIDDYIVEYCRVGETLSSCYYKVMGRQFIVIHEGKKIHTSHLMTGGRWKEYIYEVVYRLQKEELNATLGI